MLIFFITRKQLHVQHVHTDDADEIALMKKKKKKMITHSREYFSTHKLI